LYPKLKQSPLRIALNQLPFGFNQRDKKENDDKIASILGTKFSQ